MVLTNFPSKSCNTEACFRPHEFVRFRTCFSVDLPPHLQKIPRKIPALNVSVTFTDH